MVLVGRGMYWWVGGGFGGYRKVLEDRERFWWVERYFGG